MTDVKIREKVTTETRYGKGALIGFESCIMEIEFYKGTDGYYIYPKGSKGFASDIICHSKNIEGLTTFMQGALWFRLNGKSKED